MFLGETYAVPFKRYELKNTQHLVLFSPSLVKPNNFTRLGRLLRDNLFPGKLTVSIRDHEIRIFKKMLQNNDWTQSEGLVKITPTWAASADTKNSSFVNWSKRIIADDSMFQTPHFPYPLNSDKAIGDAVSNCNRSSWQNRQAFCTNGRTFITDPFLYEAFFLHLLNRTHRLRRHKTVLMKLWIYILFPVNHIHQIIKITNFFFRSIFPQQILRHCMMSKQHRLIHSINI